MKKDIKCIICAKKSTEARLLLSVNDDTSFYICDSCIQNLADTVADWEAANGMTPKATMGARNPLSNNDAQRTIAKEKDFKEIKPSILKAHLDQYVIGQENAKKIISVGVYNHYKRIHSGKDDIKKSNILMVGPTGCGKTEIARTISKFLDVPFVIADATSLTEAGYVGDDVENILLQLLQEAGGDMERAERGIIYLDEIDKIGRKGENVSITRDVSGEGVQQALLKMVEGADVRVPQQAGRKHPNADCYTMNTRNILFIGAGAFEGIDKIVKGNDEKSMGFSGNIESTKKNKTKTTSQDIIKFGLIPELVGRFPVIAQVEKLTKEDLVRILVEPKNSITKQYQDLLSLDEVKLTFEQDALEFIAETAEKNGTGARGLKTIIEDSMVDIMFETPDNDKISEVIVTREMLENNVPPKIVYRGRRSA